jgi:hypothetical protein
METIVEPLPINLESSAGFAGIWDIFEWTEKAQVDELFADLMRQNRELREAHPMHVAEAFFRGEHRTVKPRHALRTHNKITDGLLRQTFGLRLMNDHTGTEDQVVRYIAIGSNGEEPSRDDPKLKREIFRAAPITKKADGDQYKFLILLDFDDANPPAETTITSASSTTVITLASVTGLNEGDTIRIQKTAGYEFRVIVDITGLVVTINTAMPALPVATQTVLRCLGEGGAFGNTNATSTPESGKLFNRALLPYDKTDSKAVLVRDTIIAVPV